MCLQLHALESTAAAASAATADKIYARQAERTARPAMPETGDSFANLIEVQLSSIILHIAVDCTPSVMRQRFSLHYIALQPDLIKLFASFATLALTAAYVRRDAESEPCLAKRSCKGYCSAREPEP